MPELENKPKLNPSVEETTKELDNNATPTATNESTSGKEQEELKSKENTSDAENKEGITEQSLEERRWDEYITQNNINLLINSGKNSFLSYALEEVEKEREGTTKNALNSYLKEKLSEQFEKAKEKEHLDEFVEELFTKLKHQNINDRDYAKIEKKVQTVLEDFCNQKDVVEEVRLYFHILLEEKLKTIVGSKVAWQKLKQDYMHKAMESEEFTNHLSAEQIVQENPVFTDNMEEILEVVQNIKKNRNRMKYLAEQFQAWYELHLEDEVMPKNQIIADIVFHANIKQLFEDKMGIKMSDEEYQCIIPFFMKRNQDDVVNSCFDGEIEYYIFNIWERKNEKELDRVYHQNAEQLLNDSNYGAYLTIEDAKELIDRQRACIQKKVLEKALKDPEVNKKYQNIVKFIDEMSEEEILSKTSELRTIMKNTEFCGLCSFESQVLKEYMQEYYEEKRGMIEYQKSFQNLTKKVSALTKEDLIQTISNMDCLTKEYRAWKPELEELLCREIAERKILKHDTLDTIYEVIYYWSEKDTEDLNVPKEYTSKLRNYLMLKYNRIQEECKNLSNINEKVSIPKHSSVFTTTNQMSKNLAEVSLKAKRGKITGYVLEGAIADDKEYFMCLHMSGLKLLGYEITDAKNKKFYVAEETLTKKSPKQKSMTETIKKVVQNIADYIRENNKGLEEDYDEIDVILARKIKEKYLSLKEKWKAKKRADKKEKQHSRKKLKGKIWFGTMIGALIVRTPIPAVNAILNTHSERSSSKRIEQGIDEKLIESLKKEEYGKACIALANKYEDQQRNIGLKTDLNQGGNDVESENRQIESLKQAEIIQTKLNEENESYSKDDLPSIKKEEIVVENLIQIGGSYTVAEDALLYSEAKDIGTEKGTTPYHDSETIRTPIKIVLLNHEGQFITCDSEEEAVYNITEQNCTYYGSLVINEYSKDDKAYEGFYDAKSLVRRKSTEE